MTLFTCVLIVGFLITGLIHGRRLDDRQVVNMDATTDVSTDATTDVSTGATPDVSTDGTTDSITETETTQAATTTLVGDPNCKDKLKDCLKYGHASCTGPYEAWAHANCEAFCGFCIPITSPFICENKINNCNEYGSDLCTNPVYNTFVEKNCLKYCHMCPGCFDDFERCDEFGKDTCTSYPSWSKIYCSKYCNFCESNETSEATTTSVPTSPAVTTPRDDSCYDKDDCSSYDIHTSCCGQYEAFARDHCPKHCRFCTPKVTQAPLCSDTIPNCDQYNEDLCTNVAYESFVETKCAGYCKLCNRTVYVPECARGATGSMMTTLSTTPAEKKCKSHGMSHSKGESWNTYDCYQTCECQDPDTNKIKCGPLECPKAQPDCDLIYVIGGCCPVLKCSYLQVVHGEMTQELNGKISLMGK